MKKKVTIEAPVVIGDFTLIAVARSTMECKHNSKGTWLFGIKLPIALVVVSGHIKRGFWVTGEEVPIEQLIEEVPELGRVHPVQTNQATMSE